MLNRIQSIQPNHRKQQMGFGSSFSGVRQIIEHPQTRAEHARDIVKFVRDAREDGQDLHYHIRTFFDGVSNLMGAFVQRGAKEPEELQSIFAKDPEGLSLMGQVTVESTRDEALNYHNNPNANVNLFGIMNIMDKGPQEIKEYERSARKVK